MNKLGAEMLLYYLGWMVRAKGTGDSLGGYPCIEEYLVGPNWRKYNCEPASLKDLYNMG